MSAPSQDWKEVIPAGEAEEFESLGTLFRQIHERLRAKHGAGRAFHLKPIAPLKGRLDVLPDLPAYAAQGLFAAPASFPVVIRLSNGAFEPQSDKTPDIRGYALSIEGVTGTSALHGGAATTQDFLLINREVFGIRTVRQFVELVDALTRGPLAALWFLLRTFGPIGAVRELLRIVGGIRQPFSGFLSEDFFSAAPVAWGPYAARVRLRPAVPAGPPVTAWREDVAYQLRNGPVTHELQAQFFVDEARTPIEDALQPWDAPFVTVARLTVEAPTDDPAFAAAVEQRKFDPYNALVEHRPIGFVMRARKTMYYISQKVRGVA
jgi:hypothetical protein